MWVEAESSKIGDVHLPAELWRAMKAADGVELQASVEERAAHLLREYRHFTDHPDGLKELVRRLGPMVGKSVAEGWCGDIDAGRWVPFVAGLLERHYDPAYRHSRERDFVNVRERLEIAELSEEGVRKAAVELVAVPADEPATSRGAAADVSQG